MAIDGGFRSRNFVTPIMLCILLAVSHVPATAQTLSQRLQAEPVEMLAQDARQKGNAVRGAILFTQQNLSCTRCHVAGAARPVGPDLTQLSRDTTDVYLVEALLNPSKVIRKGFESVTVVTTAGKTLPGRIVEDKPERVVIQVSSGDLQRVAIPRSEVDEIAPNQRSAMPDNLVDQLAGRDQFLDLVRYMMELAAAETAQAASGHSAGGNTIGPELQGIVLLKELNCSACHRDDITRTHLAEKQAPDLVRSVSRIHPRYLQRFIAQPHTVRPGTTMPDTMSGLAADQRQAAAMEITHYLKSLSDRTPAGQPIDAQAATRGRELFHSVGCVACHSPRDDNEREMLAETSVPLGAVHNKYHFDGLIAFLKNPLETRPSGRMPGMQLTHWEAIDLASYLCRSRDDESDSEPFVPDQSLVAKGKTRFARLGCRQCHRVDSADVTLVSLPLSKVRPNQGCLSVDRGHWPVFSLSTSQRSAIQAAIGRESEELSRQDHIGVALTAFRCLNCHQRGDLGGVSSERNPHFKTANPNLGPQGRIPPPLTGVGAKLNPQWMRQVLVSSRTIRPYVLTRMPQFGTENVEHLVDLFHQADQLPPVEFATIDDQKEIRKIGAEMVGTGGLNCIVCHTFQLKKAANMPAVDLTEMAERLQKTWFYHYMQNPQRMSQNTIMPSFWPGGRAMRRDILDGNRDLQIEALWQYLLDGRQARTPRGLIREPLELLATDEAVMLRRSYPDIGKRGIGVGYPHQVNLAFDAEQMRLAMIWKGKFADPGGVWRSQGHGRVRPLGDNLIRFATGPDLDDAANPWIVDEGRPPSHRFKGYSLDERMRPRFRYQLAGMSVEDYPVDVVDSSTGRPFIRRTIVVKSESSRAGFAFRAATGKTIVKQNDREFVVDDRLRIRIDGSQSAEIIDGTDQKQLRIPLPAVAGSTEITLEYRW